MDKLLWIRLTALSGAITVMLGAFAAHSMKATLTPQMLDIYQTGVLYHFIHTVALLGALGLPLSERSLHWAARCFCPSLPRRASEGPKSSVLSPAARLPPFPLSGGLGFHELLGGCFRARSKTALTN